MNENAKRPCEDPLGPEMNAVEGALAGCVFCRIVRGELPCTLIHENEDALVFADLHPAAPVHWLVAPRRHISRLGACERNRHGVLLGALLATANEAACLHGLVDFRLIINNGPEAGQTVPHLHVHVLGGASLGERLI